MTKEISEKEERGPVDMKYHWLSELINDSSVESIHIYSADKVIVNNMDGVARKVDGIFSSQKATIC